MEVNLLASLTSLDVMIIIIASTEALQIYCFSFYLILIPPTENSFPGNSQDGTWASFSCITHTRILELFAQFYLGLVLVLGVSLGHIWKLTDLEVYPETR